MYADDSHLQTISKFVSRGLKLCGKSSLGSRLCKTQSVILDRQWTTRVKPKLTLFHGGSSAEGTATASSDVDRMAVVSGITVVTTGKLDKSDKDLDTCNLFFVESTKNNPGYARLKAAAPHALNHDEFGDFSAVLDDNPNGLYLSSDKFINFLHSANKPPVPGQSKFYYRHGPCLMVEHQNIFGYHRGMPGEHLEADVAFSLVCDQWPEEVNEWITRPRHHNWPVPQLVNKISKQDCHAVAVGDPTSPFCSQEWRISFLLGERELVWNFNDTQIQTYIILKMLLKKYIEPLAPDQLSSYHLKTVMFWLIEEEGNSRWFEENLLICVSDCLDKLQHCIEEGNIEHYFHRKRNLLRYKLRNESERNLVLNEIASIRKGIAAYTLNGGLVKTSKVYKLWCACKGDIGMFIQLCSRDIELTTYFELVKKVNDTRRLHQSQFNIYVNMSACCDSLETLLQITKDLDQTIQTETDIPFLNTMLQFLDILTGLAYFRLSMQERDATKRSNLGEKCRERLVAASSVKDHDLSGILYLATFYFYTNQHLLCQDAVKCAFPKTGRYLYTGRCSTNHGIEFEAGKIILSPEVPVTGEDDEVIHPVFDVVFTKADIDFVPYPVKFECALIPEYGDRFFVYHPCVYAHTLLYLSLCSVRDMDAASETLENLAHIVGNLGVTPQRFRALNLLGFCYSMKGDFSNASCCYIASLQDTFSMRSLVTNAAAFHLVLLLFSLFLKAEKDSDVDVIYKRR